jgi:acetyl-CoA carboxylase biotin carboxyl carrier protein
MGAKVADEVSKGPGPFDVKTIKQLIALMSQHDLNEIDLYEGEQRIRLRRGLFKSASLPPSLPAAPAVVQPTLTPSATSPAPEPVKAGKPLTPIKSPTPGTFYASAKPGTEPYVKVGSRVTPTTVVCMIEAMKIFNEITADCTGVITEVLAENQQPVEYGQVLFQVDTTS